MFVAQRSSGNTETVTMEGHVTLPANMNSNETDHNKRDNEIAGQSVLENNTHLVTHIDIIKSRRVPGANRIVPLITNVWETDSCHYIDINLCDIYSGILLDEFTNTERQCIICKEVFLSVIQLGHHVKKAHNIQNVSAEQCFVCRKKFIFNSRLKEHLSQTHGVQSADLICKVCFMEFSSAIEQRAHERKHEKIYHCHLCVQKYSSEYFRQKHIASHFQIMKPFECDVCGKRFKFSETLNVHLKRHNKIFCPLCFVNFDDDLQLLVHLKLHTSNEQKQCLNKFKIMDEDEVNLDSLLDAYNNSEGFEVKDCIFGLVEAVSSLEKTTENERQVGIKCLFCKFHALTTDELLVHRQKAHLRNKTCILCGKRCISISQVLRHMGTHTGPNSKTKGSSRMLLSETNSRKSRKFSYKEKQLSNCEKIWRCEECDRLFQDENSLIQHKIKKHFKETKCTVCSKVFYKASQWRAHLKTHLPQDLRRKYKCDFCPLVCTTSTSLKMHRLIHFDEKPFTCPTCKKSFRRSQAVKRHISQVHKQDETPFKCVTCPMAFANWNALLRHFMRAHRHLRRYICSLCCERFPQNQDLQIHVKKTHGIEVPKLTNIERRSIKEIYVIPDISCLPADDPQVKTINVLIQNEKKKFDGVEELLRNGTQGSSDCDSPQINSSTEGTAIERTPDAIKDSLNERRIEITQVNELVDRDTIDNCEITENASYTHKTFSLFCCDLCHKLFVKSSDFNDHIQLRTQYSCKQCAKSFCDLAMYEKHLVSHEQFIIYHCINCSNYFKDQPSFIEHAQIVNGVSMCITLSLPDSANLNPPVELFTKKNFCLTDDNSDINRVQDDENITNNTVTESVIMLNQKNKECFNINEANSGKIRYLNLNKSLLLNNISGNIVNLSIVSSENTSSIASGNIISNIDNEVVISSSSENKTDNIAHSLPSLPHLLPEATSVIEITTSEGNPKHIHGLDESNKIEEMDKTNTIRLNSLVTRVNLSQCGTCGEAFSDLNSLTEHQKTHNSVAGYTCDFCSKVFKTKQNLNIHQRSHTGERPFSCIHCNKSFRYQSDFSEHIQSHSGIKPFVCQLCGNSFTRKRDLARHAVVHTKEKKFKCTICNKAFARLDQLKSVHMPLHAGIQPVHRFSCDECDKTFVSRFKLEQHKGIHTGPSHACSMCSKSFHSRTALQTHLNLHMRQRNYIPCPKCSRRFVSQQTLEIHLKTFHVKRQRKEPKWKNHEEVGEELQAINEPLMEMMEIENIQTIDLLDDEVESSTVQIVQLMTSSFID